MPPLITPNPGDTILANHIAQLTGLVAGVADRGQAVKLIQVSDASNYALAARNAYATSPKLLRAYSTLASVDTDWLTVIGGTAGPETGAGQVTARNLVQFGMKVFDVEAYGDWATATDHTPMINAAIAAAVSWCATAGATSGVGGARIRFMHAYYYVGSINATGIQFPLLLDGLGGAGGVALYATRQTAAVHGAAGKPVVDMTGSSGMTARSLVAYGLAGINNGFRPSDDVTGQGTTGYVTPSVGFLIASTANGLASAQDSTKNMLVDCGSVGNFQAAALYVFGGSDNIIMSSGFQQWEANLPCAHFGAFHHPSVVAPTSLYKTLAPNGTGPAGDQNLIAVELHAAPSFAAYLVSTASPWSGEALTLYGVDAFRYFGGNIACNGQSHVAIFGTASNGSISFHGTQFYPDAAATPLGPRAGGTTATPTTPSYLVRLPGATVNGLTIDGCNINSSVTSSVILGTKVASANVALTKLNVRALEFAGSTAPTSMLTLQGDLASVMLQQGDIDCNGKAVTVQGAIGKDVHLHDPGTLTITGVNKSTVYGDGYTAFYAGGTKKAAQTGLIRIQSGNVDIMGRNNADNADLPWIGQTTGDLLLVGVNSGGTVRAGSTIVDATTSTELRVGGSAKVVTSSTGIGFNGASAWARTTYTVTNGTTDRALNVTGDTLAQGLAVLGTLIADLQARGDIG